MSHRHLVSQNITITSTFNILCSVVFNSPPPYSPPLSASVPESSADEELVVPPELEQVDDGEDLDVVINLSEPESEAEDEDEFKSQRQLHLVVLEVDFPTFNISLGLAFSLSHRAALSQRSFL